VEYSGLGRAPADPLVGGGGYQTSRILKLFVGSFGQDSILLIEGSIPDRCYQLLKSLR